MSNQRRSGPGGGLLRVAILAAALAAALTAAGCQSAGVVQAVSDEAMVATAKRQVYPALVYVKPIIEELSGGEQEMHEVFGSGVIIDPSGLVVTNDHVVAHAARIRCVLFDKEQLTAELVGRDQDADLALLRLIPSQPGRVFPYAEFGDSDRLEEGNAVLALGSPYGFTRSITKGIISNTRRYISFDNKYEYNLWLQTDAAINPGNSGGPLVDMNGRIVGINALMIWMANDLGFAIPSKTVIDVVERIKKDGRVKRTWTGLELQPLKDFDNDTFVDAETGVLIGSVDPGSPSEGRLQQGDLLLKIAGVPVDGTYKVDLPAIRRQLAYLTPDLPVVFTVQRGDKTLEVEVVPEEKGAVEGKDLELKRWNMTVKSISKFENPRLAFSRLPGVFAQPRQSGNAANAGLQHGDILLTIDGTEVRTLDEVKQVYDRILADDKRDEKTVLIEVLRGPYREWLVLNYQKDYEEKDDAGNGESVEESE